MEKKLFREKSVKKISSPEELNDYMRVTTPRVWIILFIVIVLLTGALVWGFFGSVTITNASGDPQTVNPFYFIIN